MLADARGFAKETSRYSLPSKGLVLSGGEMAWTDETVKL